MEESREATPIERHGKVPAEGAAVVQTIPHAALLGATADLAGCELLFDPEGFPEPGCEFGCKAKIAGAFPAVGVILATLLRNRASDGARVGG